MHIYLRGFVSIVFLAMPLLCAGCSTAAYDRSHTDIAGLPNPGEAAAAPQTSVQDSVPQSVKSLLESAMRYQVPDSMTAGASEVVNLRISGTVHEGRLVLGIPGVSESVKFADSIRAELSGGDDFVITPHQANEAQAIPPAGSVTWSWDIKAVRAGASRPLLLHLDTYVDVNGRDVLYRTDKETKINVSAAGQAAWLWGLLAVPALLVLRQAFVPKRRKRRVRRQVPTVTGEIQPRNKSKRLKQL